LKTRIWYDAGVFHDLIRGFVWRLLIDRAMVGTYAASGDGQLHEALGAEFTLYYLLSHAMASCHRLSALISEFEVVDDAEQGVYFEAEAVGDGSRRLPTHLFVLVAHQDAVDRRLADACQRDNVSDVQPPVHHDDLERVEATIIVARSHFAPVDYTRYDVRQQ